MDFEKGKCYRVKDGEELWLIKFESMKDHRLDARYKYVIAEKGIFIPHKTNGLAAIGLIKETYLKPTEVVEIDESLLDRVIKMFIMNKNAILALINKDE